MKTGIGALDSFLDIGDGIITLRASDPRLLSPLATAMLVRACRPGKRILYLHFVEYHDRYWTIDIDGIVQAAKMQGADVDNLLESVFFLRVFSRDTVEMRQNWQRIFDFGTGLNLVILDSISDLYKEPGKKDASLMSMTHAIGMFARLCAMNSCHGVVFDNSPQPIHPYLGEHSAVIIEVKGRPRFHFEVQKHPCKAECVVEIQSQHSLARWL